MGVSEHSYKQFDAELESIRSRVLEMGGLVESQIRRALEALAHGNSALSDAVIADDHRVNAMEVTLDEDCSQVIVRRQPAANDLRLILAITKTVTDLERIGDEAVNIAELRDPLCLDGGRRNHRADPRARAGGREFGRAVPAAMFGIGAGECCAMRDGECQRDEGVCFHVG